MSRKRKIVGAFAGKFLPPHIGHANQIEESAKQCDELYVVVADSDKRSRELCKKSNIPHIPAKLRVKWLTEHFKDNPKIKILYMNEGMLEVFPNGLEKWKKHFSKVTRHRVAIKFADETYREMNEKYFPECKFICFNRTIINISATQIRNDPEKYFDFIIDEAKPFFKNIIKQKNISKM